MGSNVVIVGSLTAAGQNSPPAQFYGPFNCTISGTFSATVELQRSLDGGTTWVAASTDGTGTAADYTIPVTVRADEPEYGALWRLYVKSYASGTINYRLSQRRVYP